MLFLSDELLTKMGICLSGKKLENKFRENNYYDKFCNNRNGISCQISY